MPDVVIIVLLLALVPFIAVQLFIRLHPQFGAAPNAKELEKLSQSPQWNGKIFENQIETTMNIGFKDGSKLLKKQLFDRKGRSPKTPIPIDPFDQQQWSKDDTPKFVWYGHSVLLLQLKGKNLLIDPMFGPDAAPNAPFKIKRFSDQTLDIIDQLPPLDAILITHDHYDHLDLASIRKLKNKSNQWFVALGVKRHLTKWGVNADAVQEFDWWDSTSIEGIEITFTPSRHFSGRAISDRTKSLWGGFSLITEDFKVYWSGDGGEGPHFKEVGERLGPFDWAFMENGQYNTLWHAIHMYPEEAVLAGIEAQAKVSTPVHWAGFPLALHHWKDPIERFVNEAKEQNQIVSTPKIGQIVRMTETPSQEDWWTSLD
jgi:L-ascorbate metabolism protein UlaG (beta-lactamase superfamily)